MRNTQPSIRRNALRFPSRLAEWPAWHLMPPHSGALIFRGNVNRHGGGRFWGHGPQVLLFLGGSPGIIRVDGSRRLMLFHHCHSSPRPPSRLQLRRFPPQSSKSFSAQYRPLLWPDHHHLEGRTLGPSCRPRFCVPWMCLICDPPLPIMLPTSDATDSGILTCTMPGCVDGWW